MKRTSTVSRYAERVLDGVDDGGSPERIVVWIERMDDGRWAVGRAVNPQHRPSNEPRPDDYISESWELDDALGRANAALEDDARVLEADGVDRRVLPFTRKEIIPRLERWFFRGT